MTDRPHHPAEGLEFEPPEWLDKQTAWEAYNGVDLESLKREVYLACCKEGESKILNNLDFNLVSRVIDYLAPRIVREGLVVVPETPTQEMIDAFYDPVAGSAMDSFAEDEYFPACYKSMIAASKQGGLNDK